jgi:predicted SnoaL-like aldol condensation-catalyzing enzyme
MHQRSRLQRTTWMLSSALGKPLSGLRVWRNDVVKIASVVIAALVISPVFAQERVTPARDQQALLESGDPKLAANKRVAFDFWRVLIEARHVERAAEFMTEAYIQHNPNVPSGRKGFIDYFSSLPRQELKPDIRRPLVAIVAEGDFVVMSFVDERKDPKDSAKTYTTTWFDMFRIEHGKIAEHWDAVPKQ